MVHGELAPGWSWEGSGGLVRGRSWRPGGQVPGRFGPGRVLEAWGVDSVPEGLLRCFFGLIFGFWQILQIAPHL